MNNDIQNANVNDLEQKNLPIEEFPDTPFAEETSDLQKENIEPATQKAEEASSPKSQSKVVELLSKAYPCGRHCPECGGDWKEDRQAHDGLGLWECSACRFSILIKTDNLDSVYACGLFADKVANLFYEMGNRTKENRIEFWKNNKQDVEGLIHKYSGALQKDPKSAILLALYKTYGFEVYPADNTKTEVENLYEFANSYVKENKNATEIKTWCRLYRRKLKYKLRNRLLIAGSAVAAVIIALFAGLGFYAPSPMDQDSGIIIEMPGNAISMFDKFTVDVAVEEQPTNSASYIDAKNALRNETEKFALYDISLVNGNQAIQPKTDVTVNIPIPKGYQPSCLKVYHIISDEKYEQISSTVSVENNTISFETDHFSLFAVAERHPIVTFDSNGGNEIDFQIVERDSYAQAPTVPTKKGYRFEGWMNEGKKWSFDTDTVKKDITLTAKWAPIEYTVSLFLDGAYSAVDSLTVAYLSAYTGLPTPQKAGYTFKGWYTAKEYGELVTAETVMDRTENHTLYAVFSINKNQVIFDPNGGEGSMQTLLLNTGTTARLYKNTFTYVGHTFKGWSTSPTGAPEYADEAEYTMGTEKSYTLYAQWEKNKNTLHFDANGGEGTMNALTDFEYNHTQKLPAVTFTRFGYKFIGWSTEAGENKPIAYENLADYTMGADAQYTLYAQWEEKTFKIFFSAGDGTGTMGAQEVTFGQTITLNKNLFTREGYDFHGWALEPNGALVYTNQQSFPLEAFESNFTLYALWKGNENSFTFHAGGATSGNMRTDFKINTGEEANLPTNEFKRDGYEFIGWGTSSEGSVVDYLDGAVYKLTVPGEVHLYAKWKASVYSITYEENGGSEPNDGTYTIESGDTPLLETSRTGYTFLGWFTNPELTGEPVSFIPKGSFGDKVFYAKWKLTEYEISFDVNGGKALENKTHNIEHTVCQLPIPERTGYDFAGWHKDAKFTDEPTWSIDNTMLKNAHYIAKWTPHVYSVTFVLNEGEGVQNFTYTVEDSISQIELEIPTRAGYTFVGWYENKDFTGEPVTEIHISSHIDYTFYAKWKETDQVIKFIGNGGTVLSDIHFTVTQKVTLPDADDIKRSGYTFVGWFDNEACTGTAVTEVAVGTVGDKTYYAKWTIITYTVTFDVDGNTVAIAPLSYTVEAAPAMPQSPTKAGYDFAGWYKKNPDGSKTKVTSISTAWLSDVTLYAEWKETDLTVTLVGNGAILPYQEKHFTVSSEDITLPVAGALQYNGYAFVGWFDNKDFTGDAVLEIPKGTTTSKTYYAKWEIITYYVEFISTGTAVAKIPFTVEDAITFGLDQNTTKQHYVFEGWYSNNNYTGSKVVSVAKGTCNNITLYACFTPTPYNIQFDSKGGTAIETIVYDIENGKSITVTPVRLGYTFEGWYESESYSGDPVTAIVTGRTGNITLYAKWKLNSYTVKFNSNGGTKIDDITYTVEGADIWLSDKIPTKAGYKFINWVDEKGTVYTNIETQNCINISLTAVWEAENYKIIYHTAPGDAIANGSYTIETGAILVQEATRLGYGFEGWYDNKDFTGEPVTEIRAGNTGNKEFYAKWSAALEYTIKFNANGGSLINDFTYTILLEKDIILKDTFIPTKEGYTFVGWLDENNEPILKITPGSVGHRYLTADWVATVYDIVYHTNGGVAIEKGTYTIEEEIILPIPVRNGYNFEGWYDNPQFEGDKVEKILKGNTGNKEFHAKWSLPLSYTITFEVDGGKIVDTHTYTIEDTPHDLSEFITIKTGYRFNGWYTNEACTGEPITALPAGTYGDITLYCEWLPDEVYNTCFDQYKVTDSYGSYVYTKGTAEILLPNDTLYMTGVPKEYSYDAATHHFFYVMVDGHWDSSKTLTENDIVYGTLSGVGMIGERSGALTIDASCISGKTFTVVVLDNKNGAPDYSSYTSSRVFHFTVGAQNPDFASGLGSELRPYWIKDVTHLNNLASSTNYYQNASLHFKLYNDIDLKDTTFSGIPEFYGHFDGNGHSIYNFTISSGSLYVGFIGSLKAGAVVENLTIGKDNGVADVYSVRINGNTGSTSTLHVGAIAGENMGTIRNCMAEDVYVFGSNNLDTGSSGTIRVSAGAITGANYGGEDYQGIIQGCTVTSSYIQGNSKTAKDTNPARTESKIGGICGYTTGEVYDCCVYNSKMHAYAYSKHSGLTTKRGYAYVYVGYLVGQTAGSAVVSNCYAKNIEYTYSVDSDNPNAYHNAFVAYISSGTTVENCQQGIKPTEATDEE